MRKIYTVTRFDTKQKQLTLLVRETEQEAKEQIEYEINCLKERDKVLEVKIDYNPNERCIMGANEHNGYCRTKEAEYFWHTDCIAETVFNIK